MNSANKKIGISEGVIKPGSNSPKIESPEARKKRIAARRGRIQEKIDQKLKEKKAIQGSAAPTSPSSGLSNDEEFIGGTLDRVEKKGNAIEAQIEASRKQLEEMIIDGEALITNVKVAAEFREKTRKVRHEQSQKERISELQEASKESQKAFEEVNTNWLLDAEKALPLELYEKIQAQQKACNDLLEKKDGMVAQLKLAVDDYDFEYEKNLEMYQKDILLMGDRIDDHIDNLRTVFLEELQLIEDYSSRDRDQLLQENQKEFKSVLEEFETLEKKLITDRKNESFGKFETIVDVYANVKEESNAMKFKIEDDFQTLQQELEQIKFASQLNLDKLEYNLQVLRRREKENIAMKNSMKRLLLKLQDRFNEKAVQMKTLVLRGKGDSERVIKEIQRLEESCSGGNEKVNTIYSSDYQKYQELWDVNEEILQEKIERLLGLEEVIFEEHLGIPFENRPDLEELFTRPGDVDGSISNREGEEQSNAVARNKKYVYPPPREVSEFWGRFERELDTKGSLFWETVFQAFKQYEEALKGRNKYLEDICKLYQENYEFGHLLKNSLKGAGMATEYLSNYPTPNPVNISNVCD